MVVHTAAGRNLEILRAEFADVGCSDRADGLSEPIENLRNLGPAGAGWLRAAGVSTVDDLKRLGPTAVWRLVGRSRSVSRNLLWAMAAGLEARDQRDLSDAEKQQLLSQLEQQD